MTEHTVLMVLNMSILSIFMMHWLSFTGSAAVILYHSVYHRKCPPQHGYIRACLKSNVCFEFPIRKLHIYKCCHLTCSKNMLSDYNLTELFVTYTFIVAWYMQYQVYRHGSELFNLPHHIFPQFIEFATWKYYFAVGLYLTRSKQIKK